MAVLSALLISSPFPTQEHSWYSFLLEDELTPGLQCTGEIRPMEISTDLIRNQTCDVPACSMVPQQSEYCKVWGSGCSVGIFMDYELDGKSSIPAEARTVSPLQHPNQLLHLPNLLSSVHGGMVGHSPTV